MSWSALFWNSSEGRVRAFWRLLAQFILFVVAVVFFGVLTFAISAALLFARSGGASLNITNPSAVASALAGSPLLMFLNVIASLLAVVISVGLAIRFLDHRPFADLGFHFDGDWWLDFAFGLGLGGLLMVGIFVTELAFGWVTITNTLDPGYTGLPFGQGIMMGLLSFIAVGIYEEMLARGYQLRNLAEGLNFRGIGPNGALALAWLISSAIFGLLHAGNPNATFISTLNLLVAGLFLGLGFVLTGELAIPIGLHITWNFFEGDVFGFPVSGLAPSARFIAIVQNGPEAWTGGPFGPEAGIVGIAATLIGGLLTLLWVRCRRGRLALCTPPTQYFGARVE